MVNPFIQEYNCVVLANPLLDDLLKSSYPLEEESRISYVC